MESSSPVLAVALVVFLGGASAVLVWDGLALGFGAAGGGTVARRRARLRLAAGVLGFALALWAGLGLLTHAH
jgi:hypothetical protein